MNDPDNYYSAAIRIYSETMNAARITEVLGSEATSSHEAGDPVSRCRPAQGYRKQAMWMLSSSIPGSAPLEEHIVELVAFIEEKESILAEIRPECGIDIFCGVFSVDGQGGFYLESSLTSRLGRAGVDLIVDVYTSRRD